MTVSPQAPLMRRYKNNRLGIPQNLDTLQRSGSACWVNRAVACPPVAIAVAALVYDTQCTLAAAWRLIRGEIGDETLDFLNGRCLRGRSDRDRRDRQAVADEGELVVRRGRKASLGDGVGAWRLA